MALSDFIQNKIDKTIKKHGAFFAFSKKQFQESKKDGVKYSDLGAGLICPSTSVDDLMDSIDAITKAAIEKHKESQSKKTIIVDQLYNHEAFYTGEISDTLDALNGYGYTEDEVWAIYWEEYPNADL